MTISSDKPASTEDVLDAELAALFVQVDQHDHSISAYGDNTADNSAPDADQFVSLTMTQVNQQYRRNIVWRMALGALFVLIAIPIQDLTLALAPLFLTRLIDVPNQLVADLLAPVNSVGSLVSLILLGVRLTQKKLMDRLAIS